VAVVVAAAVLAVAEVVLLAAVAVALRAAAARRVEVRRITPLPALHRCRGRLIHQPSVQAEVPAAPLPTIGRRWATCRPPGVDPAQVTAIARTLETSLVVRAHNQAAEIGRTPEMLLIVRAHSLARVRDRLLELDRPAAHVHRAAM